MPKKYAETLLEAAGIACGAAAGFTVTVGLGLAVLAVGLVLFGLAVGRG